MELQFPPFIMVGVNSEERIDSFYNKNDSSSVGWVNGWTNERQFNFLSDTVKTLQ